MRKSIYTAMVFIIFIYMYNTWYVKGDAEIEIQQTCNSNKLLAILKISNNHTII